MKKKLILAIVFTSVVLSQYVPSIAEEGNFPYKLTTADTPDGYELVSSYYETNFTITQSWNTPTDNYGLTSLTVTDYNTTNAAKSVITGLALFSPTDESVSGSDDTVSVILVFSETIYARNGKYVATCISVSSTHEEVITLLEAQMDLINGGNSGGSAPGFSIQISLIAIGIITVLLKKKN